MKAVVFHGIGDIRLDEVADPRIEQPTDAIEAYKTFGSRGRGWTKVKLEPAKAA
jgi:threonine dehydrogenase-like Zn-dependent dehydrogenase